MVQSEHESVLLRSGECDVVKLLYMWHLPQTTLAQHSTFPSILAGRDILSFSSTHPHSLHYFNRSVRSQENLDNLLLCDKNSTDSASLISTILLIVGFTSSNIVTLLVDCGY